MPPFYYTSLARLKLALRSDSLADARKFLRRFPLSRWAAKVLISDRSEVWVKVESGLAEGLHLRLNPTLEGNYWLGYHEPDLQENLRKFCRPGYVAYDVGAYLGFFSLAIAKSIGPAGKVFAFEPDHGNCVRIQEHATRNNLSSQIQVVEAAVWSYSCPSLPFRLGGIRKSYGGLAADGVVPVLAAGDTIPVPSISLDAFTEQGNPLPDILKVDVEGGECEVLKGAEKVFSRSKPVLFCEVHHAESADWIAQWLAERGYAARWNIPEDLFPRLVVGHPRS
ncbi:MAG TPA: FkbM family methyltransferase [Terriglobia bacterium]|nr:FkbM family methyltransferase [Terriglobia bacterium]